MPGVRRTLFGNAVPAIRRRGYRRRVARRAGRARLKYARRSRLVQSFSRMCPSPNIVNSGFAAFSVSVVESQATLAPQAQGLLVFAPRFSDIATYSEFTVLYDCYRLRRITYDIAWTASGLDALSGSAGIFGGVNVGAGTTQPFVGPVMCPYIVYARDFDDTLVPANETVLLEYGNVRKFYFGDREKRVMRISFKPNIVMANLQDTNASPYSVPVGRYQWMNVAYPNIAHAGVKAVLVNPSGAAVGSAAGVNMYFRITAKMWFQMKGLR